MKRNTILIILRAALIASLLSAWLGSSFPFPVFLEKLLDEDILPLYDEGLVYHAWALGPLFLVINSLAWLPFTIAVAYPLHKGKILVRALGAAILVAGVLSVVAGCWEGVPFLRYHMAERIHFWDSYVLFFAFFPRMALGAIAVFESYRMLKTPWSCHVGA